MSRYSPLFSRRHLYDFAVTIHSPPVSRTGDGPRRAADPRVGPLGADDKPAAAARINVGFIGTGNQGLNDIKGFLGDGRVQIVAVCDLTRESPGYWNGGVAGREPARRLIEKHYGGAKKSGTYKGCATYEDFRDLLGARTSTPSSFPLPTTGTPSRSSPRARRTRIFTARSRSR